MDPSIVREQIDRILNSQSFANKAQLRRLLEVLYKNMESRANETAISASLNL